MRSALVNNTSYVVENIIMADPVDPSPFDGVFMVGLVDPVYETKTDTVTTIHPAGTIVSINQDGTILLTLPDGTKETFPAGTTVITNKDKTVTTIVVTTQQIMVSPGTLCNIGWVYDPTTNNFIDPNPLIAQPPIGE